MCICYKINLCFTVGQHSYLPNHLKVCGPTNSLTFYIKLIFYLTQNFCGYESYKGIRGKYFNFVCSQSTVSRIVNLIMNTNVDQLLPNKIKFPITPEEIAVKKLGYLKFSI